MRKIHLMAVGTATLLALASFAVAQTATKDICETAKAAGSFETLGKLVKAAGLEETIKGKGPLTVFAPTDEAFAKIPKDKLDSLLNDKAKLKEILMYHVVMGEVMAAEASKLESAKTAQGSTVRISSKNGNVMINESRVTKADIRASNGVIHVIDTVLMPSVK